MGTAGRAQKCRRDGAIPFSTDTQENDKFLREMLSKEMFLTSLGVVNVDVEMCSKQAALRTGIE